MKSIADIYEKLKVDDINLNEVKFPIDGTLDDMIKFLEENEFKYVYVYCGDNEDEYFNKYKSKCFYKDNYQIWFGDTTKEKISKDNPIFTYNTFVNVFSVYYYDNKGRIIWLLETENKNSKENKKEFLEELKKHFGWV